MRILFYDDNLGIKFVRLITNDKPEYRLQLHERFGSPDKLYANIGLERDDCLLLGHALIGVANADKEQYDAKE